MNNINSNILIQPNETPKAYRLRLYKNKVLYGLNNKEIGSLCNKAFDVTWDESAHRKKVKNYLEGYNDAKSELGSADQQLQNMIDENKRIQREIHKERVKFQTEKLDYNKYLREEARDELILEKIIDTVKTMPALHIPNILPNLSQEKSYALCFSDPHYGVEFQIHGLFGEIINEYSPEIFEKRMWTLFYKVKNLIEKECITTLRIFDFGDSIDGMLRVSQIWKLRYGVVDSTVKYAEFISTWLSEFTKFVRVEYQMVMDSNHSQLRELGQPKNTFKNDNMSKFISAFIKERLSKNPNFNITENVTGLIFEKMSGYNLLGIHGEVKNMENALKDFSQMYKVPINYLLGGHIHHGKYEEIGQDTEVINIPSIIGIDDYSLSLLKCSNSGAKLFCFEEGNGKAIEYSIKLQEKQI